ncbi:MAG: AraC family transcriptional regulator [Ruminiclostridium sp.]|nr:AraC family transcriptional regulator [Ruminiclostridium sp.]
MFYFHYPIIGRENRYPIYLVSIGMHDCQPLTRRGTEYAYPQIFYCTRGGGILEVNGTKTEIKAGMGFFIPAEYPHEYYPVGDVWDNHWIIPGGYGCERMLTEMGLDRPRVFTLSGTGRLERIFADIHDALQHDSIYGNLRASGYLYDLLIVLDRSINHIGDHTKTSPAIKKCVDLIDTNYTRRITLEELCEKTGMSKQHICRLFRSVLDTRPTEYIAKRRIQAAKELLSGTEMTIEEIAENVGFGSSSYFCKLFKRYEGISPAAFRES